MASQLEKWQFLLLKLANLGVGISPNTGLLAVFASKLSGGVARSQLMQKTLLKLPNGIAYHLKLDKKCLFSEKPAAFTA